jgi:hypothetical protein
VTPKGWYCFSIGAGGGALELVQRLRRTDCYGAARWLLENGLSRYPGEERTAAPAEAPGQSGEDVPGEVPGLTTPQFLVLHKSS